MPQRCPTNFSPTFLWPELVTPGGAILTCKPVNAVMHAHHWRNAQSGGGAPRRDLLAGCASAAASQRSHISCFAGKTPGSSFDQLSVNCNPRTAGSRTDGVVLQFITDNFIRAGGNDRGAPTRNAGTHASAMLSVLRYARFTGFRCGKPMTWIGAAGAPNVVLSGTLRGRVKDSLKQHFKASHSTKFPGIAVHTGGTTKLKATPEVFAGGKFIMPGIKSPGHALAALAELSEIVMPHLE
jgi:hypothetical protein